MLLNVEVEAIRRIKKLIIEDGSITYYEKIGYRPVLILIAHTSLIVS